MAIDLDTFLTAIYTVVDDLYRERLAAAFRHLAHAPALTDSEVLTLAICASGDRWDSERGFWRFACQRLRHLFPRLVDQSEFNRRRRRCTWRRRRSSARSRSDWVRTWSVSGCWTPNRSR